MSNNQQAEEFTKSEDFTDPQDTDTNGGTTAATNPALKVSKFERSKDGTKNKNVVDVAELQAIEGTLTKLANRVVHLQEDTMGQVSIEIGQNLHKAKEIIDNSPYKISWYSFLAKCGKMMNAKKASRLIGLYQIFGTDSTFSINQVGGTQKAVELCRLGKPEIQAFINKTHQVPDKHGNMQEKTIKELSVRDVKELIGNLKNPQKTASSDNNAKETVTLSFEKSKYYSLFQKKPKSFVTSEILKAIDFYYKHKEKINE